MEGIIWLCGYYNVKLQWYILATVSAAVIVLCFVVPVVCYLIYIRRIINTKPLCVTNSVLDIIISKNIF